MDDVINNNQLPSYKYPCTCIVKIDRLIVNFRISYLSLDWGLSSLSFFTSSLSLSRIFLYWKFSINLLVSLVKFSTIPNFLTYLPRKPMRIHNQIRANATFRKWEVFLLDNGATNSFLPMSTTKFVTNLRGKEIQERKST